MKKHELHQVILHLAGKRTKRKPLPLLSNAVSSLKGNICPVVNRRLFPDEHELLNTIAIDIDKIEDPDVAWQTIENLSLLVSSTRKLDFEQVSNAVAGNLHKHTVAFFDTANHETATGVLIEILDRVFLATCSHTLPKNPRGRICLVGRFESDATATSSTNILSFDKVRGERPDVGYVELDKDYVLQVLQKEPLGINRLLIGGSGDREKALYLVGYPSAEIKYRNSFVAERNQSLINYQVICFTNTVLPPERWKDIDPSRDPLHQPDSEIDILYPYPIQDDTQTGSNLPSPVGCSGGGVWQGPAKDELWSPEKYRLIGIQSRWPARGRYLQATQLRHWLDLVGNSSQSIHEEIKKNIADYNMNS